MIIIATAFVIVGGLVLAAAAIAACVLSSRISQRMEASGERQGSAPEDVGGRLAVSTTSVTGSS